MPCCIDFFCLYHSLTTNVKIGCLDTKSVTKRSRNQYSSRHYSLRILFISTMFTKGTSTIELGTIYSQVCLCLYFFYINYKHLRACTAFLDIMVNEHVFLTFVLLSLNLSPASFKTIWTNQPIYVFLVECLNLCLQETSVQVVLPQPSENWQNSVCFGK